MIRFFDKYPKFSIRYELILCDSGSVKCPTTAGGMKRWGVRAAFLSHVTKVDARENARITTLTPMFYTAC